MVNIDLFSTITVIFMVKFNPTITAYMVPYITEGYDSTIGWVYFLVEHISDIMSTRALPDINTLAHDITITYTLLGIMTVKLIIV